VSGTGFRRDRRHEEEGASLIFALIFILIAALVLVALVTSAGDNIINSTNIKKQSGLEYAADGAGTLAVQSVRYSDDAYAGPPTDCLPGGGPIKIDNQYIIVKCTGQLNVGHSDTRQIQFSAYRCSSDQISSCSGTKLLQAQVTFDDYADDNTYMCKSGGPIATCGTGMTVNTWTIETASH
jgi:hypothetical protein